jgi:iron(III) transport system substrate-binding protein
LFLQLSNKPLLETVGPVRAILARILPNGDHELRMRRLLQFCPATFVSRVYRGAWFVALLLLTSACDRTPRSYIVLYCAQDQSLAEPILRRFESQSGLQVRAVFDSEAAKTVGLANRLISEASHPSADVYWGNEEFRARQLLALGVLDTVEGLKTFGQRSRQWVVRDAPVPPELESLQSMMELTNRAFKGRLSIAHPRFGTTSTHFHALRQHWGDTPWREWCRALAQNDPFIEEGNSQVVQRVARGEALLGLTDSDDILAAQRQGLKVRPLRSFPETLLIPNTLALVVGAPNPPGALHLVKFLSSPEVELELVSAGGLEPRKDGPLQAALRPDWPKIIFSIDSTAQQLEELFRR